jgi:carbonic anhydrase
MIRCSLLVVFALGALGCNKVVGEAHATEPAPSAAGEKKHEPTEKAKEHAPEHEPDGSLRYAVPFAWEVSKDEPLAKTRAWLGELLVDNAIYAKRGPEYFAPLAKGQSPRATVVTCSDSRVQADAWDSTPENDDFTIRNIGNQVKNAQGSIEYGLEHLHTPVLLVLGHTGCGAVKAAMGNQDGLSPAIRKELESMKLAPPAKGAEDKKAWSNAVIANVNLQVGFAVAEFGGLLREGKVTVVGGVYDLGNELGRGYGSISIVNVNGNVEPERLKAFEAALRESSENRENPAEKAEAEVLAQVGELMQQRKPVPASPALPPHEPPRNELAPHAPTPHGH